MVILISNRGCEIDCSMDEYVSTCVEVSLDYTAVSSKGAGIIT